jgi:hypothetical protein
MSDGSPVSEIVYGGIAGGLVSLLFRFAENYLIAPRFSESIEARKKLMMYGKPLWRECIDLERRLTKISNDLHLKKEDGPRRSLSFTIGTPQSVYWFTDAGYYITSTAYLIAVVSCWIQLYERDIVFLKFGKSSLSQQFFTLIHQLKRSFSENTILF